MTNPATTILPGPAHEDEADLQRHDPTGLLEVGQWYWVLPDGEEEPGDTSEPEPELVTDPSDEDCPHDALDLASTRDNGGTHLLPQPPVPDAWLGCVMHIGSNYVALQEPSDGRSYHTARVHFKDVTRDLIRETNPDAVIRAYAHHYQKASDQTLKRIQELTLALGVSKMGLITGKGMSGSGASIDSQTTHALAVLGAQNNIETYKNALLVAKEVQLPQLFEQMKDQQRELTRWLMANATTMEARAGRFKDSIKLVEDRIFNVSLYAGLCETVVQCRDGKPADASEKLRIMQRRLYMDEECLLDYHAGGMEFKDIGAFDAWLSKDDNLRRILPFQRCMVAMRVRREEKERDWGGSISRLLINFELKQADTATFLYIRNGEQLWRLDTELDFDSMIFPDKSMLNLAEPMMFRMWGESSVEEMITVADYEMRVEAVRENERLSKQWARDNPGQHEFQNPYRHKMSEWRDSNWHKFDESSLYFDDAKESITKRVQYYNRIALIVQGLYDRSMALHPHPPVRTWDAAGFDAAVELIYDASYSLTYGEPPSFEAYRERVNEGINEGSVLIGQDDYWARREAKKENARRDNDYRARNDHRPTHYRPCGNPGPGMLAMPSKVQARARKVTFTWVRERQSADRFRQPIVTNLTVPMSSVFNVSTYQKGDYKQFFQDPRTRAQYLKWAPLLLAAEDFVCGASKHPVNMPYAD